MDTKENWKKVAVKPRPHVRLLHKRKGEKKGENKVPAPLKKDEKKPEVQKNSNPFAILSVDD